MPPFFSSLDSLNINSRRWSPSHAVQKPLTTSSSSTLLYLMVLTGTPHTAAFTYQALWFRLNCQVEPSPSRKIHSPYSYRNPLWNHTQQGHLFLSNQRYIPFPLVPPLIQDIASSSGDSGDSPWEWGGKSLKRR